MTDKVIHAAIRNLATQIGKVSKQQQSSQTRKATVVAVSYSASTGAVVADLNLSGDTSVVVPGVAVVQGISPNVGDTVNVLKQGPTMAVVSQIGTSTDAGWVDTTLGSGFTQNGDSQGNLQYRIINDNGALKVQWQGAVGVTGSVTTVLSAALASMYRPLTKRTILAARGMGAGAATLAVQVTFATSGVVTLLGNVHAIPAHTHTLGTSATENEQHDHYSFNPENGLSYLTNTENEQHDHGLGSSTGTSGSMIAPDWVSFNGLEYFL